MDEILNSQQTTHTSPSRGSYEMPVASTLESKVIVLCILKDDLCEASTIQ